jgi:NAD(P) transhydrogenase subunit alpha
MYANNVANLLKLLITKEGTLKLDTADEVIAGALVTYEGQIVHPRVKELLTNA